MLIWREDGIIENIEGGHGYFTVNAKMLNKRNFDKSLETIPPCYPKHEVYQPRLDAKFFLTLHPTHGFIWDQEKMDKHLVEEEGSPSNRGDAENNHGDS